MVWWIYWLRNEIFTFKSVLDVFLDSRHPNAELADVFLQLVGWCHAGEGCWGGRDWDAAWKRLEGGRGGERGWPEEDLRLRAWTGGQGVAEGRQRADPALVLSGEAADTFLAEICTSSYIWHRYNLGWSSRCTFRLSAFVLSWSNRLYWDNCWWYYERTPPFF